MSSIEINEAFLNHYQLLSIQNKINLACDPSKGKESESKQVPITYYSASGKYESILVHFFKLSYFVGITPYYWKTFECANGVRRVESSTSKLHMV